MEIQQTLALLTFTVDAKNKCWIGCCGPSFISERNSMHTTPQWHNQNRKQLHDGVTVVMSKGYDKVGMWAEAYTQMNIALCMVLHILHCRVFVI